MSKLQKLSFFSLVIDELGELTLRGWVHISVCMSQIDVLGIERIMLLYINVFFGLNRNVSVAPNTPFL